MLNIVFLKSKKDFTRKEKQRIKSIIRNTASRAAKILNLDRKSIINYTVYLFDRKYVGAFTQAEDWIILSIPRRKFNPEELRGIIYHEMHHIKREFCGYTKKKITLLEALFSEGLATVFEMEQVPKRVPKHAKYTKSLIKRWLPKLRKENLLSSSFSYDEWFLGARNKPKQLGYKIGTYLIHQIQKNHPHLTLENLNKKNTKDLLKLSKVNL